jgi:phosphoinositide-3-kinase regulatory subunit 4
MKTIKCRHREGALVVKIFVKPSPVVSLGKYIEELRRGLA